MRRFKNTLFLATLLILLSASTYSGASAQSKTLYWDRFDVDMTVLSSGELQVTEHQTITFTSGTFTYGYAEIPLDKVEQIYNVAVSEPGRGQYSYGSSGEPYTYYTEQSGGNLSIIWYFPPAANTTMTFDLSYTVRGGIRIYDDGDKLQWFAIDNERDFPIMASNVTVTLPTGASFLDVDSAGARVAWEISSDGRSVTYVAQSSLSASDYIEIGVAFTHGVVPADPPSWQAAVDQDEFFDLKVRPWIALGAGLIALVIGIAGPLIVYLLWYVRGRDPKIGPVPEYLTEPPDDLPPGILGTLVDEQADMRDIVASIVDLARRGYMTIEEEQTLSFMGFKSVDHVFHLQSKTTEDLTSFEKELLESIFTGGKRVKKLSDLRNKFYMNLPDLEKELYAEMVRRKFFARRPDQVRGSWIGLGIAVLVLACGGGFLSSAIVQFAQSVICIFVAVGITGVAMLFAARHMPAKTAVGAEAAARWSAFKEYLSRIEKLTDIKEAGDQFERFLPYAIAFGMNKSWLYKFSTLTDAPAPGWYIPVGGGWGGVGSGKGRGASAPGRAPEGAPAGRGGLQGMSDSLGGGLQSMSDGLTQLLNSTGGVLSSRPAPSSGSRGFSGGGFGGGFSGGGFSGGGGGGGGGRGFG